MPGPSRRESVLGALAVAAAPAAALASSGSRVEFAALERAIDDEIGRLAAEPLTTIGRVRSLLARAANEGAFDAWRTPASAGPDKIGLMSGGSLWRKWKVQLFRVPAGASHPPHCHENLASCLVVVDGRLRVREYQRLREHDARDSVMLAPAFDGELGPGEAIVTTEDYRNAHWFGAADAPAVAVNFKAAGHFRPELLRLRNRRYVDPSARRGGTFRAAIIDRATAHERFAARPL